MPQGGPFVPLLSDQLRHRSFKPRQVNPDQPWTKGDDFNAFGRDSSDDYNLFDIGFEADGAFTSHSNAGGVDGKRASAARRLRLLMDDDEDDDLCGFSHRSNSGTAKVSTENVSGRRHISPDEDDIYTIDTIKAKYRPSFYGYLFFPAEEIVLELALSDLLEDPVGANASKWLCGVNPGTFLRRGDALADAVGENRSKLLDCILTDMLKAYDAVASPLIITLKRQQVDVDSWLPFLRTIVAFGLADPLMTAAIPKIVDGLTSGQLVDLHLPGSDPRERAQVLGLLLMAAAAEFGSLPFTLLAMDVFKKHGLSVPQEAMRLGALVYSNNERRRRDWAVRRSGQLRSLVPKWLRVYYPTVLRQRQEARNNLKLQVQASVDEEGEGVACDENELLRLEEEFLQSLAQQLNLATALPSQRLHQAITTQAHRDHRIELQGLKSILESNSANALADDQEDNDISADDDGGVVKEIVDEDRLAAEFGGEAVSQFLSTTDEDSATIHDEETLYPGQPSIRTELNPELEKMASFDYSTAASRRRRSLLEFLDEKATVMTKLKRRAEKVDPSSNTAAPIKAAALDHLKLERGDSDDAPPPAATPVQSSSSFPSIKQGVAKAGRSSP